jgi:glycosyltransferase involved in cell wall biosynthesis
MARVKNYQIVHAQFGSGCGFVTSKLNCKKIITLRGSDWYGARSGPIKGRLHGMIAHHLSKASLKRYDLIFTVSKRMKKSIEGKIGKNNLKIEVLASGIDLQKMVPMNRMVARRMIGSGQDESPWVLFSTIALNNPIKRYELAKEAYELAKRKIPGLKMKTLNAIPHHLVPFHINACNVILLTSSHEGWPNIIKEGLACNIPYVSTDVSDLRGIAGRENNCYVTDASPEALSEALVDALSNEASNELRPYVNAMDIRKVSSHLIDRYQKILTS